MIYIGENFRISADSHNIILEQYRSVENKRTEESTDKWVRLGFYSSLGGAVTRMMNQTILDKLPEKKKVTEVFDELNKIKDTIVNAVAHIEVIERESSKRGKKASDNEGDE